MTVTYRTPVPGNIALADDQTAFIRTVVMVVLAPRLIRHQHEAAEAEAERMRGADVGAKLLGGMKPCSAKIALFVLARHDTSELNRLKNLTFAPKL